MLVYSLIILTGEKAGLMWTVKEVMNAVMRQGGSNQSSLTVVLQGAEGLSLTGRGLALLFPFFSKAHLISNFNLG